MHSFHSKYPTKGTMNNSKEPMEEREKKDTAVTHITQLQYKYPFSACVLKCCKCPRIHQHITVMCQTGTVETA